MQPPVTQQRLSFDEREALFCYLLRRLPIFLEARSVLQPSHFSEPSEVLYSVGWQAVLDLYQRFQQLPQKWVLATEGATRLKNLELSSQLLLQWDNLLDVVYTVEEAVLADTEEYGFDLLQRFLQERYLQDAMRLQLESLGDQVSGDIPGFLREYSRRLAVIQGVRTSVVEDLLPEQWQPVQLQKRSTGIPFLDLAMGGGWAVGEVYGLLGTYGSGKTMMACQIASEAALRFLAESVDTPPPHVHYVTYETPPDEIRRRMIAYLARIPLDRLEQVPYDQTLSRTGQRQPYEEEMFPDDPRGEWERYQDVASVASILHISNMTGPRHNPRAGSGWVDEIHAELEKWRRRTGQSIGLVLIDYALLCTRRYIRDKGWEEDRKLRHLVGSFGDECRRLLAEPFQCAVWVLNQLSGVANRRSPTAKQSHADSAEATNFAENLWYAFCLGNKDRETNCVILDSTKTRRSRGYPRPQVLQLQGEFARFIQADDRFMIDHHSSRIVPRHVGELVQPPENWQQSSRGRIQDVWGLEDDA